MKIAPLITLLLIGFLAHAQENAKLASKLVQQGDQYFEENQYIRAIPDYKEALTLDEKNLKAQFRLGECYRLMQDYQSAEYYYGLLAQDQDVRFPLGGYYYALMQKLGGKYDAALKSFQDFSEFMVANDLHEDERYRAIYKQSKVEIDGCQLALNQISMVHPDRGFSVLQVPVNSEYSDYAAISANNDNSVYLTSARSNGKQSLLEPQFGESFADLYRFKRSESGGWEVMEEKDRFEKVINSKGGDGSGTFNRDLTKFYYTNCSGDGGVCQIYVSSLSGGRWSDPIPLNYNINEIGINSKHPSLTAGGDTLFFVSDREGGVGALDIWMSINAGGENWGPPIHLGDEINTSFNEVSPVYLQKENALIFASEGHRGFGGYDIYVARGAKFASAEIYNAGIPFNSYKDDIFFYLGSGKGFLSSNRELDESVGKFDIYEFSMDSKKELIADVSGENTIAGRNSLFTDDYNFDNSETEIINQIISRKLSSSISEVDAILTKRQLAVYNSLSSDDLERVDRIVTNRLKKMTDNMMRSIRTEDDYYYRQLTTEKRQKVDNIVTAYLEQQGLGNSISLSQDIFKFYNDLETEEREKVDVLVTERQKSANKYTPASPTYNSFTKKEQLSIDGIAMKLLQQKKSLKDIRLDINERVFLRDQLGNEKNIFQALRERWVTLSKDDANKVGQSERDLYESLSESDVSSLRSLADTYLTADADELNEALAQEDLSLFKGKNIRETEKLNKLLLRLMTNLSNSGTYFAETSFTENELQSAISDDADQTLENLIRIKPGLSEEQKQSLQRFVNSTFDSYLVEPDGVFMDETSPIASRPGLGTGDPSARLSSADVEAYNSLTANKKRLIDNIIALDYLTEIFYNRGKKLRDEAELTRIPKAERVHIAILSKNASGQELKEFEKTFLSQAFTHYGNLSEARKGFFNRVVLDDAFDMRNGSYVLPERDARLRNTLTSQEQDLAERIKKFRFNNERILTENLALEAKDVDEIPVDIIAIAAEVEDENKAEQIIGAQDILATEESGELKISLPIDKIEEYNEITITGQLVNETTDQPLASYPITLVAFDDEATVVEGYTDTDGFFDFTTKPRQYDIRFKTSKNEETVSLAAFNVEGKRKKDTETFVTATRAFFDVNSYELRPEAIILLDELIKAYRSAGKKIEIESHTDATGTIEYNLKLSKDRGYAARDYLMANGISQSSISVIWHGAGKPIANNDDPFGRQLNRRLDVRLIGKSEKNFGNFYLVRPGATLSKVAQSFGIPANSIKRLNGINGDLAAYQPIRVKAGNSAIDYDLLVPADVQADADFIYTVLQGDTLEKVAEKFNVSKEVLIEQNGLPSPDILPGMELVIYPKDR
ncbi:MAG: OmpA family protein [Bacteroidota bacterium]